MKTEFYIEFFFGIADEDSKWKRETRSYPLSSAISKRDRIISGGDSARIIQVKSQEEVINP